MSEESLRHAAAGLHELAITVEDVGLRALAQSEAGWHSNAAAAFRQALTESASSVRECAARLDQAAEAVRHHADEFAAAQERLGSVPVLRVRP